MVTRGDGLYEAMYRKAPVWSYETEYRIVRLEQRDTALPFAPAALSGLILGCRAAPGLEEAVVDRGGSGCLNTELASISGALWV